MSEKPEEIQPLPEEESQLDNRVEKSPDDELEEIIPEDVETIIEKLPEEEKKTMIKAFFAMSVKQRSWHRPMPPPDILKGYNDCFPGGAEAIFNMAKSQAEHRMKLESIAIPTELKQSGRGQLYAFIIAMTFLLVSGFLIYQGQAVAGTILGTVDLVALVTVFILGREAKLKEVDKPGKEIQKLKSEPDAAEE